MRTTGKGNRSSNRGTRGTRGTGLNRAKRTNKETLNHGFHGYHGWDYKPRKTQCGRAAIEVELLNRKTTDLRSRRRHDNGPQHETIAGAICGRGFQGSQNVDGIMFEPRCLGCYAVMAHIAELFS
jgi:hypothetical protein